jgi:hypothetical protein
MGVFSLASHQIRLFWTAVVYANPTVWVDAHGLMGHPSDWGCCGDKEYLKNTQCCIDKKIYQRKPCTLPIHIGHAYDLDQTFVNEIIENAEEGDIPYTESHVCVGCFTGDENDALNDAGIGVDDPVMDIDGLIGRLI